VPEKLRSRFFKGWFFMKLLLTTALTVTLMGCSFVPQQTAWLTACTEATAFACSDAASLKMDSKALHGDVIAAKKKEVLHQANTHTKTARSDILPKTDASSSSQPDNATTTSSIAVKPETPQTSQFDDQSDPAIKKAKATITAKMGNPASVEFVEIKRAAGKNALGNGGVIVCGFVRENNSGPRPFLYFVPKDDAYIGGYNMATSAYRHICPITL
jgi:hypothetical protein